MTFLTPKLGLHSRLILEKGLRLFTVATVVLFFFMGIETGDVNSHALVSGTVSVQREYFILGWAS